MTSQDETELDELLAMIFERYHYDFRAYARASLRRRVTAALGRIGVASVR